MEKDPEQGATTLKNWLKMEYVRQNPQDIHGDSAVVHVLSGRIPQRVILRRI